MCPCPFLVNEVVMYTFPELAGYQPIASFVIISYSVTNIHVFLV